MLKPRGACEVAAEEEAAEEDEEDGEAEEADSAVGSDGIFVVNRIVAGFTALSSLYSSIAVHVGVATGAALAAGAALDALDAATPVPVLPASALPLVMTVHSHDHRS